MASAELSRRVGKVVGCTPVVDMDDRQRRGFHEALLDADTFEDPEHRATGPQGVPRRVRPAAGRLD
jgi:hypothetical protein